MAMNKENLDYLKVQHARYLSHIDALDQKIAQAIAANTLVVSFIFDKVYVARSPPLFFAGLTLILVSLGLCVAAYKTKKVKDVPVPETYLEKDAQIRLDVIESLRIALTHNTSVQEEKSKQFDISLIVLFVGLTSLVVSVYV
ncbi:TPA: hypothetical protein HA243_03335 [Candidatus Micrarchaeota archaeon]|nr:hypothetical protein [Candidatus Micrarchaeota archaeon]